MPLSVATWSADVVSGVVLALQAYAEGLIEPIMRPLMSPSRRLPLEALTGDLTPSFDH
jgi:hypothetical protein